MKVKSKFKVRLRVKSTSLRVGQKFNWWTVIGPGSQRYYYLCRCECGCEKEMYAANLFLGRSKSCGCFIKSKLGIKSFFKARNHPLYGSWYSMIRRCYSSKDSNYKYYGKRGISVCGRWFDFSKFIEDMGDKPSRRHSIDRIDTYGNYCPENCRWASPTQQQSNQRPHPKLRYLTFRGCRLTLREWAKKLGISFYNLNYRYCAGWSTKRILTERVHVELGKKV